ncbi:MFS transporter [Sphingomonas panacis]|uniref:MFS transporter n=1 Tax=Sphingomonas panacis TaxID=1560345 RepID=A0A1B3ZCN9_9SPHN|nr:MFS transporter [Sphingomonas panacis]AOH85186.1 MFS transporter [Sphingomonas panacis]
MKATAPIIAQGHIWPARKYAWYIVSLLTLAYALAILDRVSIGLLIVPLQATLHINDTQFGLLQGMAFSLFYSVLGLPLGIWCDRSRRVPLLATGLCLWSAATIGCAFANTFGHLFIARMLVGVGEAALVPCAASLIADYFDPYVRPKAYGVFVTGSSLGTAAALTLSGLFLVIAEVLIADYAAFAGMAPWQIVFILCGTPGLLLALVIILTVREPKRHGASATTPPISLRPILQLLREHPRAFVTLMVGTVLNLVCVYAIIGWFPALFIRVHGWGPAQTGWLLGAVGMPISIFAAINSGWVISWLTKRGHKDAPMIAAICCALSMVVFGTFACIVPSAILALIGYGLNALFVNWNISGVYSGISAIVPNELRGQVMALHNILSGLLALTAGNFAVGFLSDTVFTQPSGIAWSLGTVFFACGVTSMIILMSGRAAFRAAAQANLEREAA